MYLYINEFPEPGALGVDPLTHGGSTGFGGSVTAQSDCRESSGFMQRPISPTVITRVPKIIPKNLILASFSWSWDYRATSRKHAYTCTDCIFGTAGPCFFRFRATPSVLSTQTEGKCSPRAPTPVSLEPLGPSSSSSLGPLGRPVSVKATAVRASISCNAL